MSKLFACRSRNHLKAGVIASDAMRLGLAIGTIFWCGGCVRTPTETKPGIVQSITYEKVLQTAVDHARTQLGWEFAVANPNIVLHDGVALVRVYLSPTMEDVDDWTRAAVIEVDFGGEVTLVAEVDY